MQEVTSVPKAWQINLDQLHPIVFDTSQKLSGKHAKGKHTIRCTDFPRWVQNTWWVKVSESFWESDIVIIEQNLKYSNLTLVSESRFENLVKSEQAQPWACLQAYHTPILWVWLHNFKIYIAPCCDLLLLSWKCQKLFCAQFQISALQLAKCLFAHLRAPLLGDCCFQHLTLASCQGAKYHNMPPKPLKISPIFSMIKFSHKGHNMVSMYIL